MAEFASAEWIEELSRAAADATVDPTIRLVVEQRVTGPRPFTWHLRIVDGTVEVHEGGADTPTVTLRSSREVALDIHAGRLSPQRAFLDGDLRIGGDIDALFARRTAMAEVAAVLASRL